MTLTQLEQVVKDIPAETLAALLQSSLGLVQISNQQNKIAKLMDARDAANKAANDEIATEQETLRQMQEAQKQAIG